MVKTGWRINVRIKVPREIEGDGSTWTDLEKEQGTPISDMVVCIITIVDEIKGRGAIENIVT